MGHFCTKNTPEHTQPVVVKTYSVKDRHTPFNYRLVVDTHTHTHTSRYGRTSTCGYRSRYKNSLPLCAHAGMHTCVQMYGSYSLPAQRKTKASPCLLSSNFSLIKRGINFDLPQCSRSAAAQPVEKTPQTHKYSSTSPSKSDSECFPFIPHCLKSIQIRAGKILLGLPEPSSLARSNKVLAASHPVWLSTLMA